MNYNMSATIWIRIRIKLRWLMSAIVATKEQSMRDHLQAAKTPDKQRATELRAQADLHDEASEGFKAILKDHEDDHV